MAVTIKTKALTIVRLVERLFKPSSIAGGLLSQAKELEGAGFTLSVSPMQFQIVMEGEGPTIASSVPLKLEAVTLAMKSQLGQESKNAICDKINELITQAHNFKKVHYGENAEPVVMSMDNPDVYEAFLEGYVNQNNKVKAIKMVRDLTKCSLKEAKDQVECWIDEYKTLDPEKKSGMVKDAEAKASTPSEYYNPHAEGLVKLGDAWMLHQPVFGTSQGSRYHVIAISPDTVVAVRIKENNHIAIRAVSESQHMKARFASAGLKKCTGGHYSMHLEPTNLIMAKKCIGSLLFAMGGDFSSISDRVEELVGAGS